MNTPVSLYVHIPFCLKKCLFCSFAVSIGQARRRDDYLSALDKESKAYKGSTLSTIYLGGGTPTFLSVQQIKGLVDGLRREFTIGPAAEWTIECNPEGIDGEKARALKELGFTRVSLGAQSFNEAYLKFLGRAHDRTTALNAFQILRDAGFDNINVDLMYGFPKQTRAELIADLDAVIDLKSEHVSIYTLTVEPNSRFFARQMKLDHDEKLADDYIFVSQYLEHAGFKQYEISNFAKPGFASKHNMAYWLGNDYIGLGMGAHSLSNNRRFWNTSNLMEYLEQINTQGQAMEGQEELSAQTRLLEMLIFGLRMNQGVKLYIIEKAAGVELPQPKRQLIKALTKEGFLEENEDYIKATLKGRLILDEIAARLI